MMKLHVFILHTKTLSMRKSLCEELQKKLMDFGMFDLRFYYVEDFDTEQIGIKEVEQFVDLSKLENTSRFNAFIKNIHMRQLSCSLKHTQAYKLMQEKEDIGPKDMCLVLEDDVVYSDNVGERLLSTIHLLNTKEIKEDFRWDLNFLGLPQPITDTSNEIKVSKVNDLFVILPEISSYLIRPFSAKKMLEEFFPIKFKTNVHMSYVAFEKTKDKIMYTMSTPNVFVDGSKFGVYLSSLEPNNKLILNQDYTRLYTRVYNTMRKQKMFSEDEKKELEDSFETIKFKTHPEIQSLKGEFYMYIGEHKKAKEILDNCYKTYISNNCILNGESEFLPLYARVFKYFQEN